MPAGELPTAIVRRTSFVAGSMRETVPSPEFATQTAPATAAGSSPTRMVSWEYVLGSRRVTESSPRFATQSAPRPYAIPTGRLPR